MNRRSITLRFLELFDSRFYLWIRTEDSAGTRHKPQGLRTAPFEPVSPTAEQIRELDDLLNGFGFAHPSITFSLTFLRSLLFSCRSTS